MQKAIRVLCFLSLSGLLLFAAARLETEPEKKMLTASVIQEQQKVTLSNKSDGDADFEFKINGKVFQSMNEILVAISKQPNEFDKEPIERKAWRYVTANTEQLKVHSSNVWIHNPLLMLNSLGFGLCDDLASVLSFIWKKQGFKSRVWGLEGHVVPEVFAQGKWQMYDPTFGVYYLNNERKVASVDELGAAPELIYEPHQILPPNLHRAFIVEARKYSKDIASLYASKENNQVSDFYDQLNEITDFKIHLPKGASLEFPVQTPDSIFVPYLLGRLHLQCFIKLSLPENWYGKINFPFMVCQLKGRGKARLQGKEYLIEESSLNSELKQMQNYHNEIEFVETTGKAELYALLNPYVFNNTGQDTITIGHKNLESLTAVAEKQTSGSNYFFTEQNVSASAWKYYNLVMSKKDTLDLPFFNASETEVNPEMVSKTIRLLVSQMDDLTPEEKIKRADLLVKKWEAAYPKLKEVKLKKKFSFNSDPVYFALFLGYLESNTE
jgi:hypothetical protein